MCPNARYTGYTVNLKARVEAHNAGRGAKYTRGRRPVAIVYSRGFRAMGRALTCEYAMKQLTRVEKEALITGWCERSARRRRPAPA